MEITILHGQAHQGSTYHIAKQIVGIVADGGAKVHEFFFPGDYKGSYCRGCKVCFFKGENFCPDSKDVQPITEAMFKSDLIVLASPTYCYGITGSMKAFLDHLGYFWMEHRPDASMFKKVGLAVSTSGYEKGSKRVVEQLTDNMNGWGLSEVIEYPKAVFAGSWEIIPPPIKASIEADIPVIAEKVKSVIGKAQTKDSVKETFMETRAIQQRNVWNKLDRDHWEQAGWLAETRPWDAK